MNLWMTILFLSVVAPCISWAQAGRSYVQAAAAYVSPSGTLTDSARFRATTSYTVGYQWSPSRAYSFGVTGWYMPAEIDPVSAGLPTELRMYDPASVFGMNAVVTYRPLKHGFTPYVAAELGFGSLSVPDALVGNKHVSPQLGFSIAGTLGFLLPVSEKLDVDLAARYAQTAIGGGLTQVNGLLGLRYRLR
jgi:hypothetical protein